MRALITGASGFAGTHLVRHLVDCGDEVLATGFPGPGIAPAHLTQLQALASSRKGTLESSVLDVGDVEACARVIGNFRPSAVYHLAGLSFVPDADKNFLKALQINVAGFQHVVRVCQELGGDIRVLLVSSGEVYGKVCAEHLPLTETTRAAPANNYSLTKYMAELVAERYSREAHVSTVIVRAFNHIGPGQDSRFVTASFADQLVKVKHGQAPPVLYVGNLKAKRDFSDVRDIVRAYRLLIERGKGIYNVGSGRSVAVEEILNTLIELSGLKIQIKTDLDRMRASETPEVFTSIAKINNEVGWEPRCSLHDTLRDILEDAERRYRSN